MIEGDESIVSHALLKQMITHKYSSEFINNYTYMSVGKCNLRHTEHDNCCESIISIVDYSHNYIQQYCLGPSSMGDMTVFSNL